MQGTGACSCARPTGTRMQGGAHTPCGVPARAPVCAHALLRRLLHSRHGRHFTHNSPCPMCARALLQRLLHSRHGRSLPHGSGQCWGRQGGRQRWGSLHALVRMRMCICACVCVCVCVYAHVAAAQLGLVGEIGKCVMPAYVCQRRLCLGDLA